MNQILSTNNNSNKNTVNIKKITTIFCAIIVIFGLIVVSIGGYRLYKSRNKDSIIEKINKPELIIKEMENGEILITAKYDQGLSKLSYIWNNASRIDSNIDGKTFIERTIEIPQGLNNTLKVIAVGTDGSEETLLREFTSEGDSTDPVIEWVVASDLNIVATDDTELAFLTYQWAGDEVVKVEPSEDKTKIEKTIEIKRGANELTVVAVDTFGNSTTKTRTFKGVQEPEISWVKIGNTVEMSITHDMGFQKIIFIVNNEEYVYDKNYKGYDATKTEIKYKTELKPGENSIIIKAYSNEGSEKIKEGKTTYTP